MVGGVHAENCSVAPTLYFSPNLPVTFMILKISSRGMAPFNCLLFWENLTSRIASILDAKVTAFESKSSMLHMCSELAEERQLPPLVSKQLLK